MILNGVELNKEYVRRGKKFNAVKDAEFFAWSGDFTLIYGESGSGKSTLLSILAGVGDLASGSVELDGQPLFSLSDEGLSYLRNKRIGYVPQGVSALSNFTVVENIRLGADLYDSNVDEEWLQEILENLSIAHLVDEYPANLSGGELRRVAIARALVNKPDLIIADEPTSNLDEDNSMKVFSLLNRLAKKGTAVIVATHDRNALKYGDRIYHMKAGVLAPESHEYGDL